MRESKHFSINHGGILPRIFKALANSGHKYERYNLTIAALVLLGHNTSHKIE